MSSSSSLLTITSRPQFYTLLDSTPYLAIQAHATWCGPCKAISPVYTKLADAHHVPEAFVLAHFDIDAVPDLAQELGISTVPAFFFFEDGNKDDSMRGADPKKLERLVEEYSEKAKAKAAAAEKKD